MLRIILFLLLYSAGGAGAAGTLMVFGDSISAGYGLAQGTGWVSLLQQRLTHEKYDYKVVNASISGETTTGGKNRIEGALAQYKPHIVVLELGGNDGLRGTSVETMKTNLTDIITACHKQGALVLLVGMELPPNYGNDYMQKFRTVYQTVAKSQRVVLVPYLFAGFGENRSLFQPDGIHPTAAMQTKMLDTVWRYLGPMLSRASK